MAGTELAPQLPQTRSIRLQQPSEAWHTKATFAQRADAPTQERRGGELVIRPVAQIAGMVRAIPSVLLRVSAPLQHQTTTIARCDDDAAPTRSLHSPTHRRDPELRHNGP
jgi:hypothetical protein